jgi:hypothetical protein
LLHTVNVNLHKRRKIRLLTKYGELVEVHQQLNRQLSALMDEQSQLFAEQRELLKLLLHWRD